MKRREFLGVLCGAVAAGPLAAHAQQPAMPVVGLLRSTPAAPFAHIVAALRQGLGDEGFVEGRNVVIEQRWADNHRDRISGLAADLVRRQSAVIIANGPAVNDARAVTQTVPIVFVLGDDPVKMGLVGSLNRPEGNLTGVTFFGGGQLGAKRLELLRELVPKTSVVAVLLDPDNRGFETELPSVQAAGQALGVKIVLIKAGLELNTAFATIMQAGADAILLGGGPALFSNVRQIVALAAHHKIPAIYELQEYVQAGGLISYAASIAGAYRQAGIYAGKILKGAKPADLPVMQPTTFELAVNLKTARALGLTVPPSIMLRADEVVE
jgi:putative tryptophan/tyrosine transport system substrate-binding protein